MYFLPRHLVAINIKTLFEVATLRVIHLNNRYIYMSRYCKRILALHVKRMKITMKHN